MTYDQICCPRFQLRHGVFPVKTTGAYERDATLLQNVSEWQQRNAGFLIAARKRLYFLLLVQDLVKSRLNPLVDIISVHTRARELLEVILHVHVGRLLASW